MKDFEEPLTRPLVSVTKKYLSSFSLQLQGMELERYHFVLLRIEENGEPLTQKALAELLQIDKSFMVNILDYLSERGYVLREKNIKDKRQQLIRLTEKARTSIPLIRNAVKNLNRKSLQNISKQQLETFRAVLDTIQQNLSDSATTVYLDFKNYSK